MTTTQTRSRKGRATPKVTGGSALAAARATRGKGKTQQRPASGINAQEREMLVARLAYFRAEKRGFAPGDDLKDWFEAEAEAEVEVEVEVEVALLSARRFNPIE